LLCWVRPTHTANASFGANDFRHSFPYIFLFLYCTHGDYRFSLRCLLSSGILSNNVYYYSIIASTASYPLLRVRGPDKQIQNDVTQMLSVKFLIAVYLLHLTILSYKNLRLCRESMMLLEYHKKCRNFVSISKNLRDIKNCDNGGYSARPDL
jgi:hypothetical protein